MDSDSALSDDNPVYIFETLVDDDPIHEQIIRSFHVPRFFTGLSSSSVRGCHVPGDRGDLLSEVGWGAVLYCAVGSVLGCLVMDADTDTNLAAGPAACAAHLGGRGRLGVRLAPLVSGN